MTSENIGNIQGYVSSSGTEYYELPTSNLKLIGLDEFTGNTGMRHSG